MKIFEKRYILQSQTKYVQVNDYSICNRYLLLIKINSKLIKNNQYICFQIL